MVLALILTDMYRQNGYSNWLVVDLGVLKRNVAYIKAHTAADVMAVVKANGYGHGIIEAARAAADAGARFCGVARVEEAFELRKAGVDSSLLVLGYTPEYRFERAIEQDISITIFDPGQVADLVAAAQHVQKAARVHVKVETGMGRLGAFPVVALDLLQTIANHDELIMEGVFTHFARADEPGVGTTRSQLKIFNDLISDLDKHGLRPDLIHSANSAGLLTRAEACFDMVRAGIVMYGLAPSPQMIMPDELGVALSWKAKLCAVRELPAGTGVSYSHAYITSGHERIGVVPVGYGDGYRRVDGNQVLIRGQRVPVVGRVCMDQMMVQLDGVPDAQVGDEVVLIGSQGHEAIHADDLAELWGTINYEVVCGVSARVPRIYTAS